MTRKYMGICVALGVAGTILLSSDCSTPRGYIQPSYLEQRVAQDAKDSKLAILLIDMHSFYLEDIEEKEKEREIPYQIDVLKFAQRDDIPVFVLEYAGKGPTIPILKNEADKAPRVKYIAKPGDDGFEDTGLAEQLRDYGVENLLLMGINASACVKFTAESALKNGFNILTSKQLIAEPPVMPDDWFWDKDHNESIDWFSKNGVYRDDYKDLLKIISHGEINKYLPQKPNSQYHPQPDQAP